MLTCADAAATRRFTLAWAGRVGAYAVGATWYTPLSTEHTVRGRTGVGQSPPPRRSDDAAVTASVRGGTIGVHHLNGPVDQILLAGQTLHGADPAHLHGVLRDSRPRQAIDELCRLGGPATTAVVIRPRPDRTAARLAAQDSVLGVAPARARWLAAPAA